jgi:hypothetical protein
LRAPFRHLGEATVDVVISLTDDTTVSVTDVHPIALGDAVKHAVDAAIVLTERLREPNGEQ